MSFEKASIALLSKVLPHLEEGFHLPESDEDFPYEDMEKVMLQVAEKMRDNYPYFHPLFAGQMLKPPHPIAKAAYMLSMWINPNNHALDGSKASSPMEKEVVAHIAEMVGWPTHLGHLTSGGTMANLEALWVAGMLHPDKKIIASDQAHYTHARLSQVLKLKYETVKSDSAGTIDLVHLEALLKKGDVGTVVCTMGTTGLGTVDPLDKLIALQKKYAFRIHADAAYGGYFKLIPNLEKETQAKYQYVDQVDSIVIDPHKHGLQPYGCGCVLFKDPEVAQFYLHDSPYTYFTSEELHLSEISLECSRAGASAVALWATHQLLPLTPDGAFSKGLTASRDAALDLYKRLDNHPSFFPIMRPETDIVVWALDGASTSEMSKKANEFFSKAEQNQLYLSLYKLPTERLTSGSFEIDTDYLICLRSSLMRPLHKEWMDALWERLCKSLPESPDF